jgi:hypothetical protein
VGDTSDIGEADAAVASGHDSIVGE